jgi:hypothetical protein
MLNRRAPIVIVSIFVTFTLVAWYKSTHKTSPPILENDYGSFGRKKGFDGTWNYKRDAENLMLDSQQCEQAFPGLFGEVERPVNDRLHSPITIEELDAVPQQNGYVRAMIYNQQVHLCPSRCHGDTQPQCMLLLTYPHLALHYRNHRRYLLTWNRHASRPTPCYPLLTRTSPKHRIRFQY